MAEDFGLDFITNYSAYLGILSATVGALIFLWKRILKPAMKALEKYNQLCKKVDTIFEELTPNGGKSMKDTQDRMARDINLYGQIQQSMAADTKAALFRTDSDGNYVWVNRTFTRTVGRDVSQVLGHGWINCIAEDERDTVVTEWYRAVEEHREFSMNFNFETPTGETTKAKCRSYRMVDSKGETIGYWGNCTFK